MCECEVIVYHNSEKGERATMIHCKFKSFLCPSFEVVKPVFIKKFYGWDEFYAAGWRFCGRNQFLCPEHAKDPANFY